MAKGWVYILSNESFPHLLKIGYSDRDPSSRVDELFTTGVPTPFVVEYYGLVEEAREVELAVHRNLEKYRKNGSREFFGVSVFEAVSSIRATVKDQGKSILWEELSGRVSSSHPRYAASLDSLAKIAEDFMKIGNGDFDSKFSKKKD